MINKSTLKRAIRYTGTAVLLGGLLPAVASLPGGEWATDLNPVTFRIPPEHAPLTLVSGGRPRASIVLGENAAGADNPADFGQIRFIE